MPKWIISAKVDDSMIKAIVVSLDGINNFEVGGEFRAIMARLGFHKEDLSDVVYKEFDDAGTLQSIGNGERAPRTPAQPSLPLEDDEGGT